VSALFAITTTGTTSLPTVGIEVARHLFLAAGHRDGTASLVRDRYKVLDERSGAHPTGPIHPDEELG
jgi:hypothetical protein